MAPSGRRASGPGGQPRGRPAHLPAAARGGAGRPGLGRWAARHPRGGRVEAVQDPRVSAHRPDPGQGRRLLRRPVGAEEPAQPRAVVRPGRLPARRRRSVRGAGLDAGERRHRAPVHSRHDRTVQHGVRPAAGRDTDGARTSLPRKGFRARPLHDLGDAARQREVAGRAAHGAGWRFSAHPRHREPLPWWPRRSGARRTGGRRRAVRQGHGAQLRHGGRHPTQGRRSRTRRTCRS